MVLVGGASPTSVAVVVVIVGRRVTRVSSALAAASSSPAPVAVVVVAAATVGAVAAVIVAVAVVFVAVAGIAVELVKLDFRHTRTKKNTRGENNEKLKYVTTWYKVVHYSTGQLQTKANYMKGVHATVGKNIYAYLDP